MRSKILLVVGARPNFMKIAPILRELDERSWAHSVLLHTGQHYDADMSQTFFEDLGIREPDIHLGVGSGPHGWQTGQILTQIEEVLSDGAWDLVVVVGDVNSTLAATLAAAKLNIPVAHVEAGLRSGDRAMPEEVNRVVTDTLAALCLTPSRDGDSNLLAEGVPRERIHFVGNVMIDTLVRSLEQVRAAPRPFPALEPGKYALVTLHRPSNVDERGQLQEIVDALEEIAGDVRVVFPVHPRTAQALDAFGIEFQRVQALEPLGYRHMLALQADAGLILTDSGGIQEESTVLGVPCLTLRDSTERPITVDEGTNTLVPVRSKKAILEAFGRSWGHGASGRTPEGWDGRASVRVVDAFESFLGHRRA
ncbi:MAG: UDP-N-acetylglucosamine 2-epimerase (non-hydrolyzing) [Gemmatimonadetes bacterium]|nr:UDP-N-acetylglucosamine 2-epimerase (non-hydrolyzing) [Gemmatimonadota bacterium]